MNRGQEAEHAVRSRDGRRGGASGGAAGWESGKWPGRGETAADRRTRPCSQLGQRLGSGRTCFGVLCAGMKMGGRSDKRESANRKQLTASGPITSWQVNEGSMETVTDFIWWSSKITADDDCSHEIKRRLLLERKAMTNLDSVLKSRD